MQRQGHAQYGSVDAAPPEMPSYCDRVAIEYDGRKNLYAPRHEILKPKTRSSLGSAYTVRGKSHVSRDSTSLLTIRVTDSKHGLVQFPGTQVGSDADRGLHDALTVDACAALVVTLVPGVPSSTHALHADTRLHGHADALTVNTCAAFGGASRSARRDAQARNLELDTPTCNGKDTPSTGQ
ncbi:hypothetical protein EXIGLDRAFT_779045 [Exidia glandulosa HHB12029]|uniref:Uncharacterized protein n=1 Tax=Exidia glandulosa HHB12029 TaxID=1314781 RepID=A0A165C8R6_EXIGL|nr:hypothetical protein EXIGLDRAFT_779045 [Exidia glandulosa HHB12029]